MDEHDKDILNIIQSDFPLVSRPYAAMGELLSLTEAEVLARVRALKETGVIRRIGGNFQSKNLGWISTLCAASVPEDRLEAFVDEVNSHPGVTHNYLREHKYNVWFTFIGHGWENVTDTLAGIREKTGIDILNLPAEKLFKIKVDFQMKD